MLNVSLVLRAKGFNILDPQSFLTRSLSLCVMEKRGLRIYVPPEGLLLLSPYFFFLVSFCFICPLGHCLHDTVDQVTTDLLLWLFANTDVGWPLRAPWSSSSCSCVSFAVFKESFSSHKGHIWPVCAWAHSSLHNLETHRSCQSRLFCHHQSGFWIEIQRCYLVWFCIFC